MAQRGIDEVVGHKTFRNEDGTFRHEPLRQSEAGVILKQIEESKAKRHATYPDEQTAIRGVCDAFERLKEFGWRETIYMPPDGSLHHVLEVGSTGIHTGYCSYRDPKNELAGKWYWILDGGDQWPSRPYLFRPIPPAESDAQGEEREGVA